MCIVIWWSDIAMHLVQRLQFCPSTEHNLSIRNHHKLNPLEPIYFLPKFRPYPLRDVPPRAASSRHDFLYRQASLQRVTVWPNCESPLFSESSCASFIQSRPLTCEFSPTSVRALLDSSLFCVMLEFFIVSQPGWCPWGSVEILFWFY